ncbi:MAG TPA: hypothetical protein VHX60_05750 [Acidobacteriaceae bacterium]|jgi:hypothetical protein|nr:hypothetical protein [Acidobacteriaceae bacterium]
MESSQADPSPASGLDGPAGESHGPNRRDFLIGLTAAAGASRMSLLGQLTPNAERRTPEERAALRGLPGRGQHKFVAIQIGARSFVDEGVDKCLDTLAETAGVNVLMPTVFTYGTGLAGRQVHDEPLPDHGVQAYDEVHGGSYARVHPEFYNDSPVKDIRAPELGDFDVLADVIPKARARKMQVYALFEEAYNPALMPGFEAVCEVDLYGRLGRDTCFNNPQARGFLTAMVSDWMTSNDLDGLMWESERQGPLNNAIGAHFHPMTGGKSSLNCFCQYCLRKGRDQGIDVERARTGYMELDRWVGETLNNPRSPDGTFVTFWRLLLQYPEILAWERFWTRSQEEMYGIIYGTAKAIRPHAQVGWHIMHLVTMSPFYSADVTYERLTHVSDFIKPSTYNNCAGPRLAQYIRNVQSTVFRDMTPDQVLAMTYQMMGLSNEPSLAALPTAGLSGASVGVETKKAIADVKGQIPIYPGIDIDIPTGLQEKRTQPSDVKAATLAALDAGAPGVVLSRKYAEMRLTNLAGAKQALQDFGAL